MINEQERKNLLRIAAKLRAKNAARKSEKKRTMKSIKITSRTMDLISEPTRQAVFAMLNSAGVSVEETTQIHLYEVEGGCEMNCELVQTHPGNISVLNQVLHDLEEGLNNDEN